MALLEVDGGESGICYALAEWMGKAGESSLSVAVSNGILTYTGQMTNRDMRAWVKTTSLGHADYTKHLALAFSGHNHFYDYVLHNSKELRVKFQAADGIKVLLAKIPLEDITETPESYQVLASFVTQHIKARRRVKDLRSDIERLQRETAEMRQRAKKVPSQLEKRTKETKLQLISAINKKKTEIYNLRHPDSPRKRWPPQLRRNGSWTRSQERLLNDEVNGSGSSNLSSMGGSFNTSENADAFDAETLNSGRHHTYASHRGGSTRGHRTVYNGDGDGDDDDDDDDGDASDDRDGARARAGRGRRHQRYRRHGAKPHRKRPKEDDAREARVEVGAEGASGEGSEQGRAAGNKPQLSKHNTLLELASRKGTASGTHRRRRKRRAASSSARAGDKDKDDEDADVLLLDL